MMCSHMCSLRQVTLIFKLSMCVGVLVLTMAELWGTTTLTHVHVMAWWVGREKLWACGVLGT